MKNLLAFFAAAVLMFGGVGWYLDWFHILSGPTANDHYSVNVDFDAKKIVEDVKKGEAKAADVAERISQEAAARKAAASETNAAGNNGSAPVKPFAAGHQ